MACQVGMALMGLMVAVALQVLPARKVHRVSVAILGHRALLAPKVSVDLPVLMV